MVLFKDCGHFGNKLIHFLATLQEKSIPLSPHDCLYLKWSQLHLILTLEEKGNGDNGSKWKINYCSLVASLVQASACLSTGNMYQSSRFYTN